MRRRVSSIAIRLLLFNVLLVFLPVAGFLSLDTFERQLLDVQERAMVQHARIASAALSTDGDALSIEAARNLIEDLGARSESRIRIFDGHGSIVADSAKRRPVSGDPVKAEPAYAQPSREHWLYGVGAWLWRAWSRVRSPFGGDGEPSSEEGASDLTPHEIVQRALSGRYAATLRASTGQRSLTLYSALPIRGENDTVIGAVMVSQSTSRTLRALWRVRLSTFKIFLLSLGVAAVLSLLVAATIARPLIKLRNEADALLDHRGRLQGRFRGSQRADEIGDLARALEQLTVRLERHLTFVEGFSADVSHEFKNPLASIRTAAELLPDTTDPGERQALGATIEREVTRLSRLLTAVREISKVDAAVDMEATHTIDLCSLWNELHVAPARISVDHPPRALLVSASRDRLLQAFGNILENAISFSPADTVVSVSVLEDGDHGVVRIDDCGPGIPPEHLDRIFDRFFTFRPAETGPSSAHDGLGLAIAKAIVEAYGGTIAAMNLPTRGARIEVRLPLVKA